MLLLLVGFGIYQSALYFHQKQVPNVDFSRFVETAESLLHFKLPADFKRVPVLGLLQVGLSLFCPGPHPVLTAGWLLNGILHAASVVLLYRIGKHFLGQNAFYFAVLAGINPWMLQLTADPIAETTLIFFILLTFDRLLARSRWCYLFAMLASMTRYEGVGLIAVAFGVDMVLGDNRRDRLRALLFAFLASVPMMTWIILWRLCKPETGHYTDHFIHTETRTGLAYWKLLWYTTFGPLLQLPKWVAATFGVLKLKTQGEAEAIQRSVQVLMNVIYGVTGLSMVWAMVYSALKKRWRFWALFAFWCLYVGLHTCRHKTLDRYTIPAIWMTLLMVFYGCQSSWEFIRGQWTLPRFVIPGVQAVTGVAALVWVVRLCPVLPKTSEVSRASAWLVYVSVGVVAVYLAAQWGIQRKRNLPAVIVCLLVSGLALASNQFQVARVVGNGQLDAEFKMLAEWYLQHAEPGDKMLTSMTDVVRLFVPEQKQNIGPIVGPEKTTQEFIQSCYRRNIKYVVWDSRQGLTPEDFYYKQGNMQKIALLHQPRDIGPFKYIDTIFVNQRRYLYIFELRPPAETPAQGTPNPMVQ